MASNKTIILVTVDSQELLKGPISVIQIDVTDQKSIGAARQQIEIQFGKLDVLMNNAGVLIANRPNNCSSWDFGDQSLWPGDGDRSTRATLEEGSATSRLDPEYEHRSVRGDSYRISKAALNMLAACHRFNFAEWGCKVLAFNPGWCVTNLIREKGREMRLKGGARGPKEPAAARADIVLGKRDADIEKNGIVDLDGGVLPW
ncbi:hypothetical protein F4813DRAFT_390979 [Daldinia decipiens]|uniref:uncharacterized protein n=1 Tax=Daldinia decipiens TaxID=326647 RepID=UPI0020C33D20|nr:uncharacterized protein F4813DRAFT_390979 [Daldinia decipiens]KAI1656299.1 hypothetical protein F4813DRAFT_390979 [Daldinia decipiens]